MGTRSLGNLGEVALTLRRLADIAYLDNDVTAQNTLLTEALTIVRDLDDRSAMAHCLAAFARLARSQGHGERAGRLFGAAEALTGSLWAERASAATRDAGELIAAARAGLSDTTLAAWQAGRALSADAAVAEALRPIDERQGPGVVA